MHNHTNGIQFSNPPSLNIPSTRRRSSRLPRQKFTPSRRRRARQTISKTKVYTQQRAKIPFPQLSQFDSVLHKSRDSLPPWCPQTTALQRGHPPLFFDLSQLPEPPHTPEHPVQRCGVPSKSFSSPAMSPRPAMKVPVPPYQNVSKKPYMADFPKIFSQAVHNTGESYLDHSFIYAELDDNTDGDNDGGVSLEPDTLQNYRAVRNENTSGVPQVYYRDLFGSAKQTTTFQYKNGPSEDFLYHNALHFGELICGVDGNNIRFELAASPRISPAESSTLSLTHTSNWTHLFAATVKDCGDIVKGTDNCGVDDPTDQYGSERILSPAEIRVITQSDSTDFRKYEVETRRCCDGDEEVVFVECEVETPLAEDDGWMIYVTPETDERSDLQ